VGMGDPIGCYGEACGRLSMKREDGKRLEEPLGKTHGVSAGIIVRIAGMVVPAPCLTAGAVETAARSMGLPPLPET